MGTPPSLVNAVTPAGHAPTLPTDTLALFWTEVREIAAELQPETVALIQVDAAVQDAAIHASGDLPERIAIKGRGGTDFRPGSAWLSEQGLRPSCCPYLTDIKCDRYPEAEPDYPVVQLGSAARRAQPPTLGRAHRHGGAMRLCVSAADERGKPIRSKEQVVHCAFAV